ncbi:vesicle transport protein GOT1B [Silurus asotus]|uniref:Vesicle transport protein GOT1B n=1 Tax=Silurus asotus TaxID=30991 RepID=A0AAD5AKJ5_SILAS|nr:vesicle transport protein GOT1B [Silurus asotus]
MEMFRRDAVPFLTRLFNTILEEIGMGLTGFGVFFLFFGMILFFDKALLAIGNILFVVGLAFVIGLERTFRFFFQKHKMKATSFFLGGVFIVLIGWPIIGVVLEFYGFFLLFRGFFPVVIGFIRRIPILGSLLNLPFINGFVEKAGESNSMVCIKLHRLRSSQQRYEECENVCSLCTAVPLAVLACLSGVQCSKEGRRFVSVDRNEGDVFDTLHLETQNENTENLSVSKAATVLLNFLQQAKDEGMDNGLFLQDAPVWKRDYF